MKESNNVTRRDFIKTSAAGASAVGASATLLGTASAVAAQTGSRLGIGFIGPGGRGFGAHVRTLVKLQKAGANIDLVAVNDVYSEHQDRAANFIEKETGKAPKKYADYRELLADKNVDAVCIGTPDHWHAKQAIDAMAAGKHVYCEKPMTKTVEQAFDVVKAWKSSGRVMQVGVQSTALPIWGKVNELLRNGKLGKVLQFQTEYFRNSAVGQWRYYKLTRKMSPKTIDWKRWLGADEGLAPDMPFDRAIYAQWRRFWPFGAGMYTDLFVHRTTAMLKATGLRFPGRVVGAGGIFLEYDGRDVPDVATVVADYHEGVQGLINATMCCDKTRIKQIIRGHYGSFVFGNGEDFRGFDFVAERPQVTLNSKIKDERIEVERIRDSTYALFKNWLDSIEAGTPEAAHCPPDLGAAAIVTVNLGARSYREGKAFHVDRATHQVSDADASWANRWEAMSKSRSKPDHIPGWAAGDEGSLLVDEPYQKLEGPWIDGKDPTV